MRVIILAILFSTFSYILPAQESVFSLIAESGEHTILKELLELSRADKILEDEVFYSVFAPDDNTFLSVYTPEGLDSLKLNENDALHNLIFQHIVPDTIYIENFSGPFLPVFGNHLNLFVDKAGNVLVSGGSSNNPSPTLTYPVYSDDLYKDAENGRVFWMKKNLILPICQSFENFEINLGGLMFRALHETGLYDSLSLSEELLTIIVPDQNETYDYINANGGFAKTPFLDSFVRRNIIEGYYPFQKIQDKLKVINWLGETLVFNKREDKYFVNDVHIRQFQDVKNAVTLFVQNHLNEDFTSIVSEALAKNIKVFPNPGFHEIEIHLSNGGQGCQLNIFNTKGQVVYKSEDNWSSVKKVDIRQFNPGMYFIQNQCGSSLEVVKLIVSGG